MDPSEFDSALDEIFGSDHHVDLSQLASPKTPINVPPMLRFGQRTLDKRMVISIGALVTVVLGCAGLYAVCRNPTKETRGRRDADYSSVRGKVSD